MAKQLK